MEQNKTNGKIIRVWENGFITLKTCKNEILRADASNINYCDLKKFHSGEHFYNIEYHYSKNDMIIDSIQEFEGMKNYGINKK